MFLRNKTLLAGLLIIATTVTAFGAEILQVKGTRALLSVTDISVYPSSQLYALDSAGKRKALLNVLQVRGDKAVAEITKGRAEPGMSLRLKTAAQAPAQKQAPTQTTINQETESSRESEPAPARSRGFFSQFLKRGTAVGLTFGLAQNSMSLTGKRNGVTEDLTLKGNSYNFLGFYDYDFSKYFTLRGSAGLESFSANGTSSSGVCDGSDCSVSFNYLAAEIHAHYNFIPGKTRVWAGLGAALLMAMSKSTTVPNLDVSQATNQLLSLEAGADFPMGKDAFIPVSLEYGKYPGSSVKADSLILRAGYGWRF